MKVVECDSCGETVSAPGEQELVGRLREHAQERHPDTVPSEEAARATIAAGAYEAADS